jgi:hypothetical protein
MLTLMRSVICAAVTSAVFSIQPVHANEASAAFLGMVDICKRPGLAPDNWLGLAKAANWAPPEDDIESQVIENLALIRTLNVAIRESISPPSPDVFDRYLRQEQKVYAARKELGLSDVYVHNGNPERIVRMSPSHLQLGITQYGDPLGAYCIVSFLGSSAVANVLPAERKAVGGLVEGAFSGQMAQLGDREMLDSVLLLDPTDANGGTPAMLYWDRLAMGATQSKCMAEMSERAKKAGHSPFELPDCARLVE